MRSSATPPPAIGKTGVPASQPAPPPIQTAAAPVKTPVVTAPITAAPPKPAPAIRPTAGGGWKIQLGAFSSAAAAKAAWGTVSGATPAIRGLTPNYVAAGAFTRLQAGPLGSRTAADQACAAVKSSGTACFSVAP